MPQRGNHTMCSFWMWLQWFFKWLEESLFWGHKMSKTLYSSSLPQGSTFLMESSRMFSHDSPQWFNRFSTGSCCKTVFGDHLKGVLGILVSLWGFWGGNFQRNSESSWWSFSIVTWFWKIFWHSHWLWGDSKSNKWWTRYPCQALTDLYGGFYQLFENVPRL